MAEFDPNVGIFRWTLHRAHDHLRGVLVGGVGIPVASAVFGLFVGQAALAVICGFCLVALLAFLYAFLFAPYQQRNMLRCKVLEQKEQMGTLIPIGWSAIVEGGIPPGPQPQFVQTYLGTWVPPGVEVIRSGPGSVTDDMNNTVGGGRIWYRAGRRGNTYL